MFVLQVCVLVPGQRCTKKLSDIQTSHMIHVSTWWSFTRIIYYLSWLQATARDAPDREYEINKIVCDSAVVE